MTSKRKITRRTPEVLSLFTVGFLMFSVLSLAPNGSASTSPIKNALAQSNSNGSQPIGLKDAFVTFKYIVFQQGYGSSTSIDFEGSAILKPVPGGFEGNGTGFYRAVDIGPVNDPCTDNTRTTYSGTMPFMVHAQYSIDNSVTGGPDTSMYNSTTSVVEVLMFYEGLHAQYDNVGGDQCLSWQDFSGFAGQDCHFYGIDLDVFGKYESYDVDFENNAAKCILEISPSDRIIDVQVDPHEIYLKYNQDQTDVLVVPKAKVTVTVTAGGAPVINEAVLIKVCTLPGTVTTDGHIDHDGRSPGWEKTWSEPCDQKDRPFGQLKDKNGRKGNLIVSKTDSNGQIILDYTPPKYKRYQYIAGTDEITATAVRKAPSLQDKETVRTKVQGLNRMLGSVDDRNCAGQANGNYTFAPQSGSKHGCLFYGTPASTQALQNMANQFMQRQRECIGNPGSAACQVNYGGSMHNVSISGSPQKMKINAMSLPWGGLTDNVGGIQWKPPHQSHNDGRQVDLSFGIFQRQNVAKNNPLCNNLGQNCKNYDIDRIMLLRDVIQQSPNFYRFPSNEGGDLKKTFADHAPHIHIFFNN